MRLAFIDSDRAMTTFSPQTGTPRADLSALLPLDRTRERGAAPGHLGKGRKLVQSSADGDSRLQTITRSEPHFLDG